MQITLNMLLASLRNEPKISLFPSAAHEQSFLYKAPKGYNAVMFCNGHFFLRLFVKKLIMLLQNVCTSITIFHRVSSNVPVPSRTSWTMLMTWPISSTMSM